METLIKIDDQTLSKAVVFSENALAINTDLPFEIWQRGFEQLNRVDEAWNWWIGDYLNYGEQRYGEMYSQVLDGVSYKKLSRCKVTAGVFPPSKRRPSLSFTHHCEVASFEESKRERLLDMAEQDGLSVSKLRDTIKTKDNDYFWGEYLKLKEKAEEILAITDFYQFLAAIFQDIKPVLNDITVEEKPVVIMKIETTTGDSGALKKVKEMLNRTAER